MEGPVTLYFELRMQRKSGPIVSRQRLIQEVRYALSDYLLPDESEYTVQYVKEWHAAQEIVATGQADKLLRQLALERKGKR